ncbi:amidase [Pseudalkalibacillus caeni]|uniref:Amidase n=1 Tax=Exobacillus caeni TaxID=2574798 RepID=A0A5R9EZE5_9BACL|nr:amidase [Pseudalkalibacillus caeni]TLS36587.1 amidase [Pseudalkalibacillus caeni]
MSILDLDAVTLAQKIADGQISSAEATDTYIRHLQQINPKINCLVENRFEEARKEALEADRKVEEGRASGKLHGVPISVKECFHVKGMKTTGGLPYRAGKIEQEDAYVIARLKEEGAIILGKTNTPALCFCQETDNKHYGRTNNPWDLNKTSGGSSGGEGALMAVGGAAVGLGADIGGSIRFPSHFNGVVGFKSGNNQVSQQGNFPFIKIDEQERMLGIGAMGKTVRDARLVNSIISDFTPNKVDLSSFTLTIPRKHPEFPLGEDTERIVERFAEDFSGSHAVERQTPPFFEESSLIWQEIMSLDGGKGITGLLSDKGNGSPLKEYMKEKMFKNSEIHYYLTWALIGTRLFKPNKKRVGEIREILHRGDIALEEYFSQRILVLPVYHSSAPLHGELYKQLFSIRKTFKVYMPYIAYANVWGLPSLVIPVAEDAEGMPLSIQLISSTGNEEALFQLGERFERQFRGYKRCTTYDRDTAELKNINLEPV